MNSKSNPMFSVVTVVLNGEQTLQKCIESVICQKKELDIEYIVVDGGSKDGTVGIIKKYEDYINYWISEPDLGIYNAWNKGLIKCSGEYVAFLGADDCYYPGALKKYLTYIRENPDVDYVSAKVKFIGKSDRIIGRPFVWNRFRRHMTVAHVGSLHKRSLFERFGNYDENLKIVGDYEFLLRSGRTLNAGFVNFVSAEMAGSGVSSRMAYRAIKETLEVKMRHKCCSKTVCLFDWFVAVMKVVMKKRIIK